MRRPPDAGARTHHGAGNQYLSPSVDTTTRIIRCLFHGIICYGKLVLQYTLRRLEHIYCLHAAIRHCFERTGQSISLWPYNIGVMSELMLNDDYHDSCRLFAISAFFGMMK